MLQRSGLCGESTCPTLVNLILRSSDGDETISTKRFTRLIGSPVGVVCVRGEGRRHPLTHRTFNSGLTLLHSNYVVTLFTILIRGDPEESNVHYQSQGVYDH